MPRRNLLILLMAALLALTCYLRAHKNLYLVVMADAIGKIERRSLEPIDDRRLFEGAMQGMLGQLDVNSFFVPADDLDAFLEEIEQQFVGVGMQIVLEPETNQLMVGSPLVGSPAYQAGVLAGDRILKIDGESTEGMTLPEASQLLRGPAGTPVALSVLHAGEKEPVEVTIVRDVVHVDTVLGDTRNGDGSWNYFLAGRDRIGYVRIVNFSETTAEEFECVLNALTDQGMRGLVLDLRNDPGGWLRAAVDVCNQLISSGVIVTIRRRGGRVSDTYEAGGEGKFTDCPMAVIVNQETASAAEIVAACMQDHARAVIVGQRTYGKGTVQELIPLQPGCGAMKLTTASYWRPSGRNIQRPRKATDKEQWGVVPNDGCEVALTDDEYVQWQLWRWRRDVYQGPGGGEKPYVDRQRKRAVEYIEQAIKKPRPTAAPE
ncbi:MAG: S41 family peptidase [Pirellulales bacterium]|nr:S41 family peptidase [Pirellulales bacterium]